MIFRLRLGVKCKFFVRLPLLFKSDVKTPVQIKAEIHVIDNLPCDLLLGNNMLTLNRVSICTHNNDEQYLELKGHNIPILMRKDALLQRVTRKKMTVYLT